MHCFLTGEIQVGKSTLIRRFLQEKRLTPCGFSTLWRGGELLIAPYGKTGGEVAAVRGGGAVTAYPAVFDRLSRALLTPVPGADILIMDELGFLENDAHEFQQQVLARLDGELSVLGVIKPQRSKFLDAVRAHPGVTVAEVTPENREDVFLRLCKESKW